LRGNDIKKQSEEINLSKSVKNRLYYYRQFGGSVNAGFFDSAFALILLKNPPN